MTCSGRRLLLCGVIWAVPLGMTIWLFWPPPRQQSAVTHESFERIRPGMTLSELEALLGGPGHPDHSDHLDRSDLCPLIHPRLKARDPLRSVWMRWADERTTIWVLLDEDGFALGSKRYKCELQETVLERAWRWLRAIGLPFG
jgi:hypothetical protein